MAVAVLTPALLRVSQLAKTYNDETQHAIDLTGARRLTYGTSTAYAFLLRSSPASVEKNEWAST